MGTKEEKLGIVLGKFYPLHKGHIHLIESASKKVDRLIVIIGSLKNEQIPGEIRFSWLKNTFHNLTILHLTDENPQYPEEHKDFWNIWTKSIRKLVPSKIDFVFSSEEYGDELAQNLGAVHICIDLKRETFPISGTKIRNNPMKYWDYLSTQAKPYFVRKIVIYGPESTGKTTISKNLANHFNTNWIPEFAREYLEAKPTPFEPSDIPIIAKGQIKLEDDAQLNANRILICDTDLLVTKVYSEHYYNVCPDWITKEAYNRKYALHLLMDIDIPWVADKLRDRGDRQKEMFDLFKSELEKTGKTYKIVNGNFQDRFLNAVKIINEEVINAHDEG